MLKQFKVVETVLTTEEIKEIIREVIKQVVGIDSIDENTNLLDSEIAIFPAYFIYIFDMISKKTELPVCKILEQATFRIMTIHSLAEEIENMQTKI